MEAMRTEQNSFGLLEGPIAELHPGTCYRCGFPRMAGRFCGLVIWRRLATG